MSFFESVPNVSAGCQLERVAFLAAAADRGGAALLDQSADPDHNRTVFTLAGEPQALVDSLLHLYGAALEHIDLRTHRGVHPRLGVVDVVPFIPLGAAPMAAAVRLAETLGEAVARRFELPVFLYAAAARQPQHRHLADLRRGGLEALTARLAGGELVPDFGPAAVDPAKGVTVIGARFFLIAFNVVLATPEVGVARWIAARVREAGGGLPGVRALGMYLASRQRAQVSMNLVDYRQTSPYGAFERISELARQRGVEVVGSEIVGLVPAAALAGGAVEDLRLERFSAAQILDDRMRAAGLPPP